MNKDKVKKLAGYEKLKTVGKGAFGAAVLFRYSINMELNLFITILESTLSVKKRRILDFFLIYTV